MEYEITIKGNSFKGTSTKMLGTAVNSLKGYVIPCMRYLIDKEKYSEKWNVARKFISEYFDLVIFMKNMLDKEISEALLEIQKASKLDSEEILEYLQKSKVDGINKIVRAIKGKVDGDDILELFLGEETEDEDDDWDED